MPAGRRSPAEAGGGRRRDPAPCDSAKGEAESGAEASPAFFSLEDEIFDVIFTLTINILVHFPIQWDPASVTTQSFRLFLARRCASSRIIEKTFGEEDLGETPTIEEIIVELRQIDDLLAQHWPMFDAASALGLTPATSYRWRAAYDSMNDGHVPRDTLIESDQLKRLKQLEAENALLRKAVSDLMQEMTMLSKVVRTDP